ncbi:MAG: FAD-linked oxidase C-terminal domain-containing protein [Bacillota bacterium]
MYEAVVAQLKEIVGSKNVSVSKEQLINFGFDATLPQYRPEIVVFATTTEQVSKVMKVAQKHKVPVTPRGAATNLSGGSLPSSGGIALSLTKMNKILEIDTENLVCVVQPGVVNQDLQDALAGTGYFYPPDPASMKVCTIGGNIAECAGGPRCLKLGVTRDYILGLEVVWPDGRVSTLGGRFAGDRDLDLVRLMVGSEGMLGIVTKAWLRLKPVSEAKKTMLAVFHEVVDASRTVSDIIAKGIIPLTLELLDNLLINCAEDFAHIGLPRDAGAILIIEVDGYAPELDRQVETIQKMCEANNARDFQIARSAEEVDKLWTARRIVIGAVARKRPSYSLQDVTVPRSNFPVISEKIVEISKKYDLPIGILAHAGDGNLHPIALFDARDKDEVDRVHKAEEEICQIALDLGGTISGEHGIGLAKMDFLRWQLSPAAIDLIVGIKKTIDPNNILNPGKMVEVS